MSLKFFLTTILMLFLAACNVAEKAPVENSQNESSSSASEGANLDGQIVYFSSSTTQVYEGNSTINIRLKRSGSNLIEDQVVKLKVTGNANKDDFSSIEYDSVNQILDPSSLAANDDIEFEVSFSGTSKQVDFRVVVSEDSIYEQDEFLNFIITQNDMDYSTKSPSQFSLKIENEDSIPKVSITASDIDTSEDGLTAGAPAARDFVVSLDRSSYLPITVFLTTDSSSTADASDFSIPQAVTFDAYTTDLDQTVTFQAQDDSTNEVLETAIVKLQNPINAQINSSFSDISFTIADNEGAPEYGFTSSTLSCDEDESTPITNCAVELTVSGATNLEQTLIVPYTISTTDKAYKNVDYVLSQGFFTINSGDTSSTIFIDPIDDNIFEGNETITLTIADVPAQGEVISGQESIDITITDNESAPIVSFIASNYTAQEGSTFYLPISMSGVADEPITITYSIGGSSTAADHSLVATSAVISAGVSSYAIPIMIYNDSVMDQDDTIVISSLSAASPGTTGATTSTTITLKEAGSFPEVSFSSLNQSVTEGATATFDITLSGAAEDDLNIQITTDDLSSEGAAVDFTAITTSSAGCSFIAAPDLLTISAGTTTCSIDVATTDDTIDEPTEQLRLNIVQPQNLVVGANSSHTIDIVDNDNPPNLSVASDSPTVDEQNSETFTFTLDAASGQDVIINYTINSSSTATLNEDYVLSHASGSLVIAEGQTSVSVTIDAIDDNNYEDGSNETVIIDIASGTGYTAGAPNSATIDIVESLTAPTINVRGAITQNVYENDIVNVIFEINHPADEDITLTYTIDDNTSCDEGVVPPTTYKCATITTPTNTDSQDLYNLTNSGTAGQADVIIPAGQTQVTVAFKIDTDQLWELGVEERFKIELINATLGTIDTDDEVEIRISDLDLVPKIYFPDPMFKSSSETNTTLTIPVNLTSASEADVTYKIVFYQEGESGFYHADHRDFTGYGNLTSGNIKTPITALVANEALTYVEGLIWDGILTIDAGENSGTIELDINNDSLYEGSEQFTVKIQSDSLDIYGYQINPAKDEFVVTLLESSSYPTVSFQTATPVDGSNNPIVTDELTESLVDIQNANSFAAVDDLDKTQEPINIEVSPISQHEDVTFDISTSGTAGRVSIFGTKESYMKGDYFLYATSSSSFSNFGGYFVSDVISANITAGAASSTTHVITANIAQDYKYEPVDETIIATISNPENVLMGTQSTFTITIEDNDDPPYLEIIDTPASQYNENSDFLFKVGLSDASGTFSGDQISEKDASFTLSFADDPSFSISNTDTIVTLSSSNNFEEYIQMNSTTLGRDRRPIAGSLNWALHNPVDAQLDADGVVVGQDLSLGFYFPQAGVITERYRDSFTLFHDNVAIALGNSFAEEVSGEFKVQGHSCSYYRGLASCFGYNHQGQLGRENTDNFGDDTTEDVDAQSNAIDLGEDAGGNDLYVRQVVAGKSHSCAVFSNGKVKCWGDNTYGQLGLGTSSFANRGASVGSMGDGLAYVDLGTNVIAKALVATSYSTCAHLIDNNIKCWGRNNYGQLGIDSTSTIGTASSHMGDNLQNVNISGKTFDLITAGVNHVCARTTGASPKIYCWGRNNTGQLGINTDDAAIGDSAGEMNAIDSVKIADHSDVVVLKAGSNHTCVSYDPSVTAYENFNTRCWGANLHGQLGLGRLTRGGMYTKPEDMDEYMTESDACSYHITNGNNCTRNLGLPAQNSDYVSHEELEVNGHATGENGIRYKPSNSTVDDDEVNVGVSNNQFVQLYFASYDIAAGKASTCVTVKDTFGDPGAGTNVGEQLTVRCWGSNYIFKNGDTDEPSNKVDLGLLNNFGHSYFMTQSSANYDNFWDSLSLISPNRSCFDQLNSTYNNDICDFMYQFQTIGDDSNADFYSGVEHWLYYNINFGGTINYGFTQDFPEAPSFTPTPPTGIGIQHEMHANSQSKFIFSLDASVDDIKIYGGSHHTCAVPIVDSLGEGENKTIKCWGANESGQAGVPHTHILPENCKPNKIGTAWACGDASGVDLDFNYTFP